MFPIIQTQAAAHAGGKRKITCTTCKLKGCVGRCRWETVDCSQVPKTIRA